MQKFIIIFFGLLLFAIIIYTGVQVVRTYAASSNRDQLVSAMYDIGTTAQKHFSDHTKKNGGGSFNGWKLPESLAKTEYGVFTAIVYNKEIKVCGVGNQTGKNGFTQVRVTAVIDSAGTMLTEVN